MERNIFKGVNSLKFYNQFNSEDPCYKYLSEIKWDGDSFVCKKCGNTHFAKEEVHIPEDAHVANMMRALPQEPCLTNANSLYSLPSISHSR